jgi:hypothetical protein
MLSGSGVNISRFFSGENESSVFVKRKLKPPPASCGWGFRSLQSDNTVLSPDASFLRDFDRPGWFWFHFLPFGKANMQDPFLVSGCDLIPVHDVLRHGKRTLERLITEFPAGVIPVFLFGFIFTFRGYG